MTQAASVHSTPRHDSSLRLSERQLDPRDVIADVLEELLIPDPAAVADTIVRRLRDGGFELWPTEAPKPTSKP